MRDPAYYEHEQNFVVILVEKSVSVFRLFLDVAAAAEAEFRRTGFHHF